MMDGVRCSTCVTLGRTLSAIRMLCRASCSITWHRALLRAVAAMAIFSDSDIANAVRSCDACSSASSSRRLAA
jgi:hypothetical protein